MLDFSFNQSPILSHFSPDVQARAIAITFYGRVPSKKNNRRTIARGGKKFSVPSQAYESWERAEVAKLKALYGSPKLTGFRLAIAPYLPNNGVRDTDNLQTSVLDCLKTAGIIIDDRWQVMTRPPVVAQPVIDRENPRVEVIVEW